VTDYKTFDEDGGADLFDYIGEKLKNEHSFDKLGFGGEEQLCVVLRCYKDQTIKRGSWVAQALGGVRNRMNDIFIFRGRIIPRDANDTSVHSVIPKPAMVGSRAVTMPGSKSGEAFGDLDEAFIRMHPIFIGQKPKGGGAAPSDGDIVWVKFARNIGDAAGEWYGHFVRFNDAEKSSVGAHLSKKNRDLAKHPFYAEERARLPVPDPWAAPSKLPVHILLVGDIFSDSPTAFGIDNALAKAVTSAFQGFYSDVRKLRGRAGQRSRSGRSSTSGGIANKYMLSPSLVDSVLSKIGKTIIPTVISFTNLAVARTDPTFWLKSAAAEYKVRKGSIPFGDAEAAALVSKLGLSFNSLPETQQDFFWNEMVGAEDLDGGFSNGGKLLKGIFGIPEHPRDPTEPSDEHPPSLKPVDFVIYGGPNDDLATPGWMSKAKGDSYIEGEEELNPIWPKGVTMTVASSDIWDYLTGAIDSRYKEVEKQIGAVAKELLDVLGSSSNIKGGLWIGPLLKAAPVPANYTEDLSRYMNWSRIREEDIAGERDTIFPMPAAGLMQLLNKKPGGPMEIVGHPHHTIKDLYSRAILKQDPPKNISLILPYLDPKISEADPSFTDPASVAEWRFSEAVSRTSSPTTGKQAKAWANYILRHTLQAFVRDFKTNKIGDVKLERPAPEYGIDEKRALRKQLKKIHKLKARVNELLAKIDRLGGPSTHPIFAGSLPISPKEQEEFKNITRQLTVMSFDWEFYGGKEIK
jgi:hypothetical protein